MPLTERDGCRPVPRRTRTFRPNYISFAGTYQCNLTCAHCCVPIEWTDRLDIATATRFLEDAYAQGIRQLGFTGGEPFLYPEFVIALTRRAAELGFRFDKIVTNGVWFQDEADLRTVLTDLKNAGFTGKIALLLLLVRAVESDRGDPIAAHGDDQLADSGSAVDGAGMTNHFNAALTITCASATIACKCLSSLKLSA